MVELAEKGRVGRYLPEYDRSWIEQGLEDHAGGEDGDGRLVGLVDSRGV